MRTKDLIAFIRSILPRISVVRLSKENALQLCNEVEALQAELAKLQDEAWSCEVCGAEIESQACRDCAIEEHEKYAKGLEQTIKDRDAELTTLKTPPRCPKCGSAAFAIRFFSDDEDVQDVSLRCRCGNMIVGATIDAALNAWRKPTPCGCPSGHSGEHGPAGEKGETK